MPGLNARLSVSAIDPSSRIGCGYSVLRLVVDDPAFLPVPVGVVAWDREKQWYAVRTLKDDERVRRFPLDLRARIQSVARELEQWADQAAVPGLQAAGGPFSDAFWLAARRRLASVVRMDPPLALHATPDPALGMEGLFDALVRPQRSHRSRLHRMERIVGAALGDVRLQLRSRLVIRAFHRVKEQVRHVAIGPRGLLVVEAINLADQWARRDADALVSRVLRLKAGPEKGLRFIVGYLSSPGGLNHEEHTRAWIRAKATGDVYDVNAERDVFRDRARDLARQIAFGRVC